ncbi:MAG TPA: hypothetical protein PLU53_15630, partial [Bacteroidia bacterium]|nr:hypothetical protein [Bacteroidia bacterium]
MKNAFLLLLFSILQCSLSGQTSSVFHIETEYTPTNGYRYYFDKLDPQSGISVRISQLPVEGFFTGYSFFNCYGHFVFQGIDSVLPNGNYVNKLYELDTLGHLLRTLPMDTATGTWYKACLPSADSPYYYALRWSTSTGQWVLETIHALSGTRNMQTLTQLVSFNYWNSDATITRDDVLWFGMDDQMQGTSVLIRVDPSNGQVSIEDTLSAGLGYYYDCLNYDCVNDTIYGFITHMDSVAGSELLKVHGASGTVIHSGSTTTGNGLF